MSRDIGTTEEHRTTPPGRRFIGDDRAVTFTVSYALTVAIATLLVTGLVATAGFVLQDQRRSAVREELDVVGNDLAITIMATDRLAVAANSTTVTVDRSLPPETVDGPYTITLEAVRRGAVLTLRSKSPGVTVHVPLRNRTHIANTSVTGGPVRVVYRQSTDELTIEEGRR